MGKFQTVTYEIHNRKIKNKEGVRFAFLADLHGSCFGEDNADLLGEIDRYAPDAVLIAGDMAVRSADVNVAFLDRFSGTLILYGSVGAVEQALTQVNDMLNRLLQFTICPVTRH